jgi:hypothetical protein
MDPIVIHRNDDKPSLYFRIWDQDNEVYLDLTDSSDLVFANFREKYTTTLLATVLCTKVSTSFGLVRMDWPDTTLDDLDEGRYEIEVFVVYTASTGSITAATQASPVVITSATHGLSTGDKVQISSVAGMTELNDMTYTITKVDDNSFSLGVDGTAYTAYTSGGTWRKINGVQTANRYYMCGTPEDDANTLQIRIKEDF